MTDRLLRSDGRRPVISVVEDDHAMRAALTDLLDAAGCEARAFPNAEELIASPDGLRSDVIVTDIQMGAMDGLSLIEKLKEIAPRRVPVIVITAMTDDCLRERAIAQGCSAFLRKPFDPNVFMEHVSAALEEC